MNKNNAEFTGLDKQTAESTTGILTSILPKLINEKDKGKDNE